MRLGLFRVWGVVWKCMSTRKLILSAILCGLAIVLAGGFKLIQVANEDVTVELLSLGTSQTLSEMTVVVEKMEQTTVATLVTVTMTGVEGSNATEGWRLLADGKVLGPSTVPEGAGVPCDTTTVDAVVRCVVGFAPTKGSATVAYLRAGEQSQWATK